MPSKSSWQDYKAAIEEKLKADPGRIYGNIKKADPSKANEDGWVTGLCPLHRDTNPSFAYNINHLGFCCLAGCGKGDVWDFITITSGQTFKEAIISVGDDLGIKRPRSSDWVNRPPIKKQMVDTLQEALWNHKNPKLLNYLRKSRGLSDDTIKSRKIGWMERRKRYVIPVFDEKGVCWNLRLYDPSAKSKMINYRTQDFRYGKPARLYGLDLLAKTKDKLVLITEGEFDSMLATQMGFTAVSGTHGCSTFNDKWVKQFKGKDVAVFYDCDEEGRRAVKDVVLPLFRSAVRKGLVKSVRVVEPKLLAGTKDDKDITDWVVKRGCTDKPFRTMVEDAKPHDFSGDPQTVPEQYELLEQAAKEPPIEISSFAEIDKDELIGKRVSCELTICSETDKSYSAVERFRVKSCSLRQNNQCSLCNEPITIPHGARDFIGSCMSTDGQVENMLGRNYCQKGARPGIDVLSRRTVREFLAHQKVSRVSNVQVNIKDDDDSLIKAITEEHDATKKKRKKKSESDGFFDEKNARLVEKQVYYLSDLPVKPGNYYAEGWATNRPQDQGTTFLIEKLVPQEDDFEAFDKADHLADLKAIGELSVEQIISDIRSNVTRVYERDELLLAMLMTYLSPRFFNFNGERLRGWICLAVIGDVGTAKTKTFANLAQWLNVGDVFSGLTGSRTGLAYSLQQVASKSWHARVGRYPANSRKLLMIDETQMIRHDELKSITKAMDEGVLEIDRVVQTTYESQTRVIFIGNPRLPRMDHYQLGCQALKNVFPIMMIRRLDFAVLANQHDVSGINKILHETHKKPKQRLVTDNMMRSLVYLMWNMRPEQIVFSEETTQACMKQAETISDKYGHASSIPLVTIYEIDKKIARLAVAMAALDGSFSDNYTRLNVLPRHIDSVSNMLDEIYGSENFQLNVYSHQMQLREEVTDYDKVVAAFDETIRREKRGHTNSEPSYLKRLLFSIWSQNVEQDGTNGKQASISRNDIVDATGLSKRFVSDKMRLLKSANLITSSQSGYQKSPKFSRLFRQLLRDRPDFFDEVSSMQVDMFDEDRGAPQNDSNEPPDFTLVD